MASTNVDIFLDETARIERDDHDYFDIVRLGDYPTTVSLYLGHSDEVVANNVDRLIEALNEVRSAALARMVQPEQADPITLSKADEDWTNREGMPEFNGSFR